MKNSYYFHCLQVVPVKQNEDPSLKCIAVNKFMQQIATLKFMYITSYTKKITNSLISMMFDEICIFFSLHTCS